MLKKRRWLSLILFLALLLALAMIVLALIPGKRPGRSVLSEMLIRSDPPITVSEFNFDVGRSRSFAFSGGSVTAVGSLGLQVLGPDGQETLRDSYRMQAPALIENNGRFIAFDIGGTAVRVFNAQDVTSSIETEGTIVSASINKNGWFCIVTLPKAGGSRGDINVYNGRGNRVFEVNMGTGYVVDAKLSDSNTTLAILNVAETGSRVNVYTEIDLVDKNRDYADCIIEFGSEIIIDIDYLSDTELLAFGTQSIQILDITADSPASTLYTFDDKRLGGYARTDDFIALHLYDYNIGYSGQIITLSPGGEILGQSDTSAEIVSMSAYGNTLMCNGSDGITFYKTNLEAYPPSGSSVSATTAGYVVALSEELALTANDLSAIVVRRQDHSLANEGSTLP